MRRIKLRNKRRNKNLLCQRLTIWTGFYARTHRPRQLAPGVIV